MQLIDARDAGSLEGKLCGTSEIFVAPEVLKRHRYTSKADVWSMGAILYLLICKGRLVTKATSKSSRPLFDFQEEAWSSRPSYVRKFISDCLEEDAELRANTFMLMGHELVKRANKKQAPGYASNHCKKHHKSSSTSIKFRQLAVADPEELMLTKHMHIVHEILHRQLTLNETKLQVIMSISSKAFKRAIENDKQSSSNSWHSKRNHDYSHSNNQASD